MKQILSVRDVSKTYKNAGATAPAVAQVSFKLFAGEILGLLGGNGAGKTTLIKMICGLERPDHGQIAFVNNGSGFKDRSIVDCMFQQQIFFDDLSIRDHILYYGPLKGMSWSLVQKKVQELKSYFGEADLKRKLRNISTSARQRLALEVANLMEPSILILDEPTAGVDPVSKRLFWTWVKERRDKGKGILVTSHFSDEVPHFDRLILLEKGKLLCELDVSAMLKKGGIHGILQLLNQTNDNAQVRQC